MVDVSRNEHWSWLLRHAIFLAATVLYFAWAGYTGSTNFFWEAIQNGMLYLPGVVIVVYPMLYILIPRFLYKKQFVKFLLWYILLLLVAKWVSEIIITLTADIPHLKSFRIRAGHFITPFVNISSIAASIKLIKYFYFQQRKAMVARTEQASAELELLKSQIHPHFLFNTLNSLFAHTLEKSPDAPG